MIRSKSESENQQSVSNAKMRVESGDAGASCNADASCDAGVSSEATKRRRERLEISRSISLIPVLPDGSPDRSGITYGCSIDVTMLGIGLLVEKGYPVQLNRYVVAIEGDDGENYFCTAAIRNTSEMPEGLRLGAEFLTGDKDLFRHENLVPNLDHRNMRMECGLSKETLTQWRQLGVLKQSAFDRVKTCPACSALPTMRDACKQCGSARVEFQRMIHHYACAHVDLDSKFASGDTLSCPKCRAHSMVVGADFEYLTGPYVCMDCQWTDTTLEPYCCCLGCNFRFPSHQAVEEEVIGYSVERLDSLAFFNQL